MAKSKVKSGNSQVIWFCFLFVCVCRVAWYETDYEEEDDSIWPASCGLRKLNVLGMAIGRSSSKPHDWPWLAVLCFGSGTADCFCSANLITKHHVITTAHCLHDKDADRFDWPNMTVHFGKHNLLDTSEDSQSRSIIDVVMHPDWNTKSDMYDADIAILRLNEAVTFNDRVRPICLPSSDEFTDEICKVVSKILNGSMNVH